MSPNAFGPIFDRHPHDEAMRRVHSQLVEAAVDARRRERDAIEKVFLRALAGGRHGVAVVSGQPSVTPVGDDMLWSIPSTAVEHPDVPWGRIVYVQEGTEIRAGAIEPLGEAETRLVIIYLARKLARDE